MTRGFIIRMVVLLVIGLLLREISGIVYFFWPQSKDLYFNDLFLDKGYRQEMTVLYFLYEISQYVKDVIDFYVFYRVSSFLSVKLSNICLVFCGYYVVQFFFYWYNRNTSYLNNASMLICMIIILIILLRKPKLKPV